MSDNDQSPDSPPAAESEGASDGRGPGNGHAKGLAPPIFFVVLVILTLLISFGLTFVWPGENRSLSYLPRFLPAMAIAAVTLQLLGLWPKPATK